MDDETLKRWIQLRMGTLIPRIGDLVRELAGTGVQGTSVSGAWADDGPEALDDPARWSLDCGVLLGCRPAQQVVRFRIVVETVEGDRP